MNLPDGLLLRWMTYDDRAAGTWRGWLSDEERARLESFGSEKRQREFVLGRAAARSLLADALRTTPPDVPLEVADDDAIDVPGTPWNLSIAHAQPHAIAVIAPFSVGADVEKIRRRDKRLKRFLLRPDEQDVLDELSDDLSRGLVLCWTLKEATLKAMRTGFRCSPKKLRLSIQNENMAQIRTHEDEHWAVQHEERDGYFMTVAYPWDQRVS